MQNPSNNKAFPKEDITPSQLYPTFAPSTTPQLPSSTENPALTTALTPPLFENCFARTINTLSTNQLIVERSFSFSSYFIYIFSVLLLISLLLHSQSFSSDLSAYIITVVLFIIIFFSINQLSTKKNKNCGKINEYQFYPTFFTVIPYPTKTPVNIPYSAITTVTESKGNIYLKINKSIGSPNKNFYEFQKTDFMFGDPQFLLTYLRANYPRTKYTKNDRLF